MSNVFILKSFVTKVKLANGNDAQKSVTLKSAFKVIDKSKGVISLDGNVFSNMDLSYLEKNDFIAFDEAKKSRVQAKKQEEVRAAKQEEVLNKPKSEISLDDVNKLLRSNKVKLAKLMKLMKKGEASEEQSKDIENIAKAIGELQDKAKELENSITEEPIPENTEEEVLQTKNSL